MRFCQTEEKQLMGREEIKLRERGGNRWKERNDRARHNIQSHMAANKIYRADNGARANKCHRIPSATRLMYSHRQDLPYLSFIYYR